MNQEIKNEETSPAPKKIQQILVPHDFSEACKCATTYGILLARIFNCQLTLVHVLTKKLLQHTEAGTAESDARSRLATISGNIQQNEGITTQAYVLKGKTDEVLKMMIPRINAIVLVAGMNNIGKNPAHYFSASALVSDFRDLRIPLLVVHNKTPDPSLFDRVILPLDFTRESKEKASWAAYFGKRNQSQVTLVHTEYRDGFFSAQLKNNLLLITKLFASLQTAFTIHKVEKAKPDIDRYALSVAKMKGSALLIITATKDWGIEDFILGPVEQKIISNEDQMPVMLVNPRDDLYVPCV